MVPVEQVPRHIAIILDGNGRWAQSRGQPRLFGHQRGAERVREIVRAAGEIGVEYLTLFALSLDNTKRPATEVQGLYALIQHFSISEQPELIERNVRVEIVGDLPSLPTACQKAIQSLCAATANGKKMCLRMAVAYGARQDVVQATRTLAQKVADGSLQASQITEAMLRDSMWTAGAPDPDLIIRTGGEKRLSDFLLLEASYAELYFTDVYWPDFDRTQLELAIQHFSQRDRRFGLVSSS